MNLEHTYIKQEYFFWFHIIHIFYLMFIASLFHLPAVSRMLLINIVIFFLALSTIRESLAHTQITAMSLYRIIKAQH